MTKNKKQDRAIIITIGFFIGAILSFIGYISSMFYGMPTYSLFFGGMIPVNIICGLIYFSKMPQEKNINKKLPVIGIILLLLMLPVVTGASYASNSDAKEIRKMENKCKTYGKRVDKYDTMADFYSHKFIFHANSARAKEVYAKRIATYQAKHLSWKERYDDCINTVEELKHPIAKYVNEGNDEDNGVSITGNRLVIFNEWTCEKNGLVNSCFKIEDRIIKLRPKNSSRVSLFGAVKYQVWKKCFPYNCSSRNREEYKLLGMDAKNRCIIIYDIKTRMAEKICISTLDPQLVGRTLTVALAYGVSAIFVTTLIFAVMGSIGR